MFSVYANCFVFFCAPKIKLVSVCARKCALFSLLIWLHCMLYLLGPEKPKTCKAELLCIKLTALLFVRNLMSFSILTSKLLVNIFIYETKIQQVKVLHWLPSDPKPNCFLKQVSKYSMLLILI